MSINKSEYKMVLFTFVLSFLVLNPEISYAANQLELVVKNGFCEIIEALTGNVGKAIATFAVIFLGVGAFFGKVNWGLALMFAAGVVAIFGAAAIASQIATGAGGGAAFTCTAG